MNKSTNFPANTYSTANASKNGWWRKKCVRCANKKWMRKRSEWNDCGCLTISLNWWLEYINISTNEKDSQRSGESRKQQHQMAQSWNVLSLPASSASPRAQNCQVGSFLQPRTAPRMTPDRITIILAISISISETKDDKQTDGSAERLNLINIRKIFHWSRSSGSKMVSQGLTSF